MNCMSRQISNFFATASGYPTVLTGGGIGRSSTGGLSNLQRIRQELNDTLDLYTQFVDLV